MKRNHDHRRGHERINYKVWTTLMSQEDDDYVMIKWESLIIIISMGMNGVYRKTTTMSPRFRPSFEWCHTTTEASKRRKKEPPSYWMPKRKRRPRLRRRQDNQKKERTNERNKTTRKLDKLRLSSWLHNSNTSWQSQTSTYALHLQTKVSVVHQVACNPRKVEGKMRMHPVWMSTTKRD